MRRPIRFKQSDLFFSPAPLPQLLPAVMRAELVSLLSALLVEVMSHQPSQSNTAQEQESDHEQQDHA